MLFRIIYFRQRTKLLSRRLVDSALKRYILLPSIFLEPKSQNRGIRIKAGVSNQPGTRLGATQGYDYAYQFQKKGQPLKSKISLSTWAAFS